MLRLYREALRIRRQEDELGDGDLTWIGDADGAAGDVLAFTRGPHFLCVTNLSSSAVALPAHDSLLLASGPLDGGLLPIGLHGLAAHHAQLTRRRTGDIRPHRAPPQHDPAPTHHHHTRNTAPKGPRQ